MLRIVEKPGELSSSRRRSPSTARFAATYGTLTDTLSRWDRALTSSTDDAGPRASILTIAGELSQKRKLSAGRAGNCYWSGCRACGFGSMSPVWFLRLSSTTRFARGNGCRLRRIRPRKTVPAWFSATGHKASCSLILRLRFQVSFFVEFDIMLIVVPN